MKAVRIGSRTIKVASVSDNDPYYQSIGDGFEDHFARLCTSFLREDDVALDIGANIGVTAAIISQVLSLGHVYAFEPAKAGFAALEDNVAANNLTNVRVYNIAISDKAGNLHFNDASAYGHISADGAQEVHASTIDVMVGSLALKRVDFIKIDVEGSEWAVLKGAADTIANYQPLIYVEFNSWALVAYGKNSPVDFAQWITDSFKWVYVVSNNGGAAAPLLARRLMKDDVLDFAHNNMVRNGCVENLLITNDETRLKPSPAALAERLSTVMTELSTVMKERDTARMEIEQMCASTSWRLTAPLRYAWRRLAPK